MMAALVLTNLWAPAQEQEYQRSTMHVALPQF